jgi:hypothetical protein
MSSIDNTVAGSGCSAAPCSLDHWFPCPPEKQKLVRYLVVKESFDESGLPHLESSLSIWTDPHGNLVEAEDACKIAARLDTLEVISAKWGVEGYLFEEWRADHGWVDNHGGFPERELQRRSVLSSELLSALARSHDKSALQCGASSCCG